MPRVAGLLLAAGAGRRFGLPKALVRLNGELLVARGMRLLADGGCDPVVVVLGARADEVRAQAGLEGQRWRDHRGNPADSERSGDPGVAERSGDPGVAERSDGSGTAERSDGSNDLPGVRDAQVPGSPGGYVELPPPPDGKGPDESQTQAGTGAQAPGRLVVVADGWPEGIGASLRAGLATLAGLPGVEAAVVTLVDMPWLGAEAVRRIAEASRARAAATAAATVATYGGRPGHPVLLGRAVWPEVAALARGDVGARAWLQANQARVVFVPCDGTGRPDDVDTPDDMHTRTK